MVSSVTVNQDQVNAILNSKTTYVADLKKKFTLGSVGYHLFKLFSCFISNSNPTKQAIKNAETIDNMSSAIKKTAAKITTLLKKEEVATLILDSRAELLAPREDAKNMFCASIRTIKQTNKLQDMMSTLTAQTQKLADRCGHDNVSAGAYVQALSALIHKEGLEDISGRKEGLEDISGRNYLVLSAIQSYTNALADKGADAVVNGLNSFIVDMQKAFPQVEPEFITTHVYKQLCEKNLSTDLEAHIANRSEELAIACAEKANSPLVEQIKEIISDFNTRFIEITTLRGPDGKNGMIDNAWIEYMTDMCKYTLEANRITSNPKAKLTAKEQTLLENCAKSPDTLRKVIRDQEKLLKEIFAREGFNRISLDADQEISSDVTNINKDLLALKAKKEASFKNYKELDARLTELTGGTKFADIKERTIEVGNFKLTVKMNQATFNAIERLRNQMQDNIKATSATFKQEREQTQALQKKLDFAKQHLFPRYIRTKDQNFGFAEFAAKVNA